MAKKKKRKQSKKESSYSIELRGILFLLIAIIGCCPFGIMADIFKGFAAFLAGSWYIVPLIGVGAAGIYMIVKREDVDYFTSNLVGLYVLILGILILSHTEYINQLSNKTLEASRILTETINNLMGFVKHSEAIQGGGMIGAVFSIIGYKLLTLEGTRVVCVALIVCGTIMFTGISIYDAINFIKEKMHNLSDAKNEIKVRKAVSEAEEEYEEEEHKQVIISSMDELPNDNVKEEVLESNENIITGEYVKPEILKLLNKPVKNDSANKANKAAINPISTDEQIPNTSTGPATVNIFPPTPITYPSDLYSIAGETTEFAKPVIGIKEPAPANFPILLNIFKPVNKAATPINTMETTVDAEV